MNLYTVVLTNPHLAESETRYIVAKEPRQAIQHILNVFSEEYPASIKLEENQIEIANEEEPSRIVQAALGLYQSMREVRALKNERDYLELEAALYEAGLIKHSELTFCDKMGCQHHS